MLVKRKTDEELYHYGVLGMKWGVRRYQNYDGSYTKKGLQRYNDSMSAYDQAKSDVKKAKTELKNSDKDFSKKRNLKESKQNLKSAKKELTKNYKKLKNDYKADKGKELYRSGKTITDMNILNNALASVSTAIVAGSIYLNQNANTVESVKLSQAGFAIGLGLGAVSGINKAYSYTQSKKLRAYYAHSS